MRRGLRNIRNATFPASPKTCLELIDAFKNDLINNKFGKTKHAQSTQFYKGAVNTSNFSYCIFSSDVIINFIKANIMPSEQKNFMDLKSFLMAVSNNCLLFTLIISIM